jgi:hypothetical protein
MHTHSPGKGKSEETTPAERGFILRPAKLLSAKPPTATLEQHHRGCRLPATPSIGNACTSHRLYILPRHGNMHLKGLVRGCDGRDNAASTA